MAGEAHFWTDFQAPIQGFGSGLSKILNPAGRRTERAVRTAARAVRVATSSGGTAARVAGTYRTADAFNCYIDRRMKRTIFPAVLAALAIVIAAASCSSYK